MQPPA
jgi:hypothetical protein